MVEHREWKEKIRSISWPFGKNNDGSCGGCRGSADKGQIFRIISRYLGLRWWSFEQRKWRPVGVHEKEKDYKGRKENSPPLPSPLPLLRRGGYRIGNIRRISMEANSLSSQRFSVRRTSWMDGRWKREREREAVIATHNEFHLCAGRTARPSIHPSVAEGRRSSNEEQT